MTILSHVLAVLFGLAVAWWLDHFLFPNVGGLLDSLRKRKDGGAA